MPSSFAARSLQACTFARSFAGMYLRSFVCKHAPSFFRAFVASMHLRTLDRSFVRLQARTFVHSFSRCKHAPSFIRSFVRCRHAQPCLSMHLRAFDRSFAAGLHLRSSVRPCVASMRLRSFVRSFAAGMHMHSRASAHRAPRTPSRANTRRVSPAATFLRRNLGILPVIGSAQI